MKITVKFEKQPIKGPIDDQFLTNDKNQYILC